MLKAILLIAAVCPLSGLAQQASSPSISTSMQELLREVAAYPRDDHQIRRTLALVVASAMRLEELQRSGSVEAESFEAAMVKQIRMARATLNLLGTNSLEDVRRDLAKNLQQSGGGIRPIDQLMGAIADREGRVGKSEIHIRKTVAVVIQTLMKDVQGPARQSAVSNLITEAAAVVRVFGDDQLALEGISHDLGLMREENRTPGARGRVEQSPDRTSGRISGL